MHHAARLALAAALLAVLPVALASTPAPATASLRFDAGATTLAGISYGIDAVDSRPSLFAERMQARIPAGLRTVWYSCPNEAAPREGARLRFEFEAGADYRLVCRPGRDAEIRRADNC